MASKNLVLLAVFMLAGCATEHPASGGSSWAEYLKSQIPVEEQLVKSGAMRPEDLQFDIQMVKLNDAISRSADGEETKKLNAELQSVQNKKIAFDRQVGFQHLQEAQKSITPETAAWQRMDRELDGRLPNGQPAGQNIHGNDSGVEGNGWCQSREANGAQQGVAVLVPCGN
ncbi:MAG TPA: hypothetical protein VF415_04280 [Rhodanobacter sp.]